MLSLRLLPKKSLWILVAFALLPLAGSHLFLIGLRIHPVLNAFSSSIAPGKRFSGRGLVQVIHNQSQEVSPDYSKLKALFATTFKPEVPGPFAGSLVPGGPSGSELPVSPPACRTPLLI